MMPNMNQNNTNNIPAPTVGDNSDPVSTFSTDDIQNLFNQAKGDIDQGRQNQVTPQDLQDIQGKSNGNMWAGMLMNLIGSSNHVNMKNSVDTLNNNFKNQVSMLGLKNQLSQQGLQRAQAEQQLGTGQIGANQTLAQQQYLQSPANNIDKATYLSLAKMAGIDPKDIKLPDDITKMQIQNMTDNIYKPAQLQMEQNKYAAMLGARGSWKLNLKTGGYDWYPNGSTLPNNNQNPSTPPDLNQINQTYGNPPAGTKIPIEQNGGPQKDIQIPAIKNVNSSNTSNTGQTPQKVGLSYSDINSGNNPYTANQQKDAIRNLNGYSKEYMDKYGILDNQFQQVLGNVKDMINESQKGNYKAAAGAAVQASKLFEGIQGRMTNMDISLTNDPKSSGYLNQINQYIQGAIKGEGKITPKDAKNMLEVAQGLSDRHDQYLKSAQQMYRTKAQQAAPGFNDDKYLFGGAALPDETQQQPQNVAGVPVAKFKSFQDLLNKKQGMK